VPLGPPPAPARRLAGHEPHPAPGGWPCALPAAHRLQDS
jgi:hypothetical protein